MKQMRDMNCVICMYIIVILDGLRRLTNDSREAQTRNGKGLNFGSKN